MRREKSGGLEQSLWQGMSREEEEGGWGEATLDRGSENS